MHIKSLKFSSYSKSPLGRIRIKHYLSTLILHHRWAEIESMHKTHKQYDDNISVSIKNSAQKITLSSTLLQRKQ